jgi:hypothetical protein
MLSINLSAKISSETTCERIMAILSISAAVLAKMRNQPCRPACPVELKHDFAFDANGSYFLNMPPYVTYRFYMPVHEKGRFEGA